MTIRVLIADDQAMVRTGFGMILGAQPDIEVVGEAADGVEAVEAARRLRPDVGLFDIRMPRLDGLQALRTSATRVSAAPHRTCAAKRDGSRRSRAAASASWTAWPAVRSQATARRLLPTSPTPRPCRTPPTCRPARWRS